MIEKSYLLLNVLLLLMSVKQINCIYTSSWCCYPRKPQSLGFIAFPIAIAAIFIFALIYVLCYSLANSRRLNAVITTRFEPAPPSQFRPGYARHQIPTSIYLKILSFFLSHHFPNYITSQQMKSK